VAAIPTFWQRLAAFLISPAEAQVLQGKAVANATVRAFIWPNLTNAIATASTGANGRYTLQLPADATGKDIVVIAEKSVTGGNCVFLISLPMCPRKASQALI
jgi:hypothetical protein